MDFIEKVEELLDERSDQLAWKCDRFYYMSELRISVPEELEGTEEDGMLLSEIKEPFWLMENVNDDDFHYHLRSRIFGLAEYLDEDRYGFDKTVVPLIKYEVTRENKLLVTCYVDKDFLKDHPDTPKELHDWLDGQISDGWGENGFTVARFGGSTKTVYSDGVTRVEKKFGFEHEPPIKGDYWEEVKDDQ